MNAVKKNFSVDFKKNKTKALIDISRIIKDRTGINISEEKIFLIESRLQRRLSDLSMTEFDDYKKLIAKDDEELQICVEHLTTHKTEWFREIVHFQWLKKFILDKKSHGGSINDPIKVWSAACSKGPEVYSLMFLFLKLGFHPDQFKILGTDISRQVLDQAINLPESHEFSYQTKLLKNQVIQQEQIENYLEMALKSSIKFREFNLINSELSQNIKFDVIFLRNVLIYFDRPTVRQVCLKLTRYLRPKGFLVLGLSESIQGEINELQTIGNSVYQFSPKNYTDDRKKHTGINKDSSLTLENSGNIKKLKKILIVEDSLAVQKILKMIFEKIKDVQVIGVVSRVQEAVDFFNRYQPDIVSLDMKLEDGTGLDFLQKINLKLFNKTKRKSTHCLLITDCSLNEGNLVLDAMDLGATTYLQKPQASKLEDFYQGLNELILDLFESQNQRLLNEGASALNERESSLNDVAKNSQKAKENQDENTEEKNEEKNKENLEVNVKENMESSFQIPRRKKEYLNKKLLSKDCKMICIGSSTGGTEIVKNIILGLKKNSPPILVVQHMPENFTGLYADRLTKQTGKKCIEVRSQIEAEMGCAYIACGGKHMVVKVEGTKIYVRSKDGEPINRFKPSVSALFNSVLSENKADSAIAIMLTGMGSDGAREMLGLKENGSFTIGQSKETCVVYGMPRAAEEINALSWSGSPEEIVELINSAQKE